MSSGSGRFLSSSLNLSSDIRNPQQLHQQRNADAEYQQQQQQQEHNLRIQCPGSRHKLDLSQQSANSRLLYHPVGSTRPAANRLQGFYSDCAQCQANLNEPQTASGGQPGSKPCGPQQPTSFMSHSQPSCQVANLVAPVACDCTPGEPVCQHLAGVQPMCPDSRFSQLAGRASVAVGQQQRAAPAPIAAPATAAACQPSSNYLMAAQAANSNAGSVDIPHCIGSGCDDCEQEELDWDERSMFSHEPILSKILNEKKLALSRSPDVIKFLLEAARRSPADKK